MGWRKKKKKKGGEYIGSTLAFSAAHHAACMHMTDKKERCEHVW